MIEKFEQQLAELHETNMDLSASTGKNLANYADNLSFVKKGYEEIVTTAKQVTTTLRDKWSGLKQKLTVKKQELLMAIKDENGNTLQGALAPIYAVHDPKVAALERDLEKKQGDLEEAQRQEKATSQKLFGDSSYLAKKRKQSKNALKRMISMIVLEVAIITLIVIAEVSVNTPVFYPLGYNVNQATMYAVVMSIVQAGWMFTAGYMIKIGFFHPTKKRKGFAITGIVMAVAMIIAVYFLVQMRNSVLASMDKEFDPNTSTTFYFLLSSVYYLAGMLPPIIFASEVPVWEKKKMSEFQDSTAELDAEVETLKMALAKAEAERNEALENAKKPFSLNEEGKLETMQVSKLKTEVEIDLPKEIDDANKELESYERDVNTLEQEADEKYGEYVIELTKRYESNFAGDAGFQQTKASVSKYLKNIMAILLLGFFFASCNNVSNSQDTTYDIISVFDKTEKDESFIEEAKPEAYFDMMHLDKDKGMAGRSFGKGRLLFSTINNVDVNPDVDYKLEYDRDKDNPQRITNRINKFMETVKGNLATVAAASKTGEENSRIYGPLVDNISKFKIDADKKILIIYSDMIENSPDANFYKQQGILGTKKDTCLYSVLERSYAKPMPALKGVEVYIVYNQKKNVKTAALANKSALFFKKWFESKGAVASIKANL